MKDTPAASELRSQKAGRVLGIAQWDGPQAVEAVETLLADVDAGRISNSAAKEVLCFVVAQPRGR